MHKSQNSYLAVDELDVLGALRVAVASTVLGTSLVVRELGQTTVRVHLAEVERAVEAAGEVGHVDGERELLVEELEHRVLGLAAHEVDTGADVGAGDELEGERVAGGRDTVGGLVLSTVESALLCASGRVRANAGVPFVTSVTVGVPIDNMDPTLVGVEHDAGGDRHTSSSSGALFGG